jgi:hypothetical protein
MLRLLQQLLYFTVEAVLVDFCGDTVAATELFEGQVVRRTPSCTTIVTGIHAIAEESQQQCGK